MTADVALDHNLIEENYPFCRLSDSANVLIMPGLLSANISFKLLQSLGGGSVLGPLMIGGEKPFQIVQMGSSVSDIVNSASIAAYNAIYSKGIGFAIAKIIGLDAMLLTISLVTEPGTESPKNTSAPLRASSKVLALVSTV